jgi:hypothetical protein
MGHVMFQTLSKRQKLRRKTGKIIKFRPYGRKCTYIITIYAPIIYTARAGQVGRGWVMEIESFLGPVNAIEPIGESHLGCIL